MRRKEWRGEGVKKHVLTAVFGRAALLDHVNFMYCSWLYVLLLALCTALGVP